MATNVGKTISAPITDEQARATRILKSSERIYNWLLQAWTSGMNELWDHWTDAPANSVRDTTKIQAILDAMGTDGQAAFSDSSALVTMLMGINPGPCVAVFQRLDLWDSENSLPSIPVTFDQDGNGTLS